MAKERRKEIKETFRALEEMFLQEDAVKSIVTTSKFIELFARAKIFLTELRPQVLEENTVNDFYGDIENAIVAIEACVSVIGDAEYADNSQEVIDRAKRKLRVVNDRLKHWVD